MEKLKQQLNELRKSVKDSAAKLDFEKNEAEIERLRADMAAPDFWQDNLKAQEVSRQEASLSKKIQPWLDLQKNLRELTQLTELNDRSLEKELQDQFSILNSRFSILKKELRFQGPYDDHDVILSIYAGAGGTDAQDWARMLLRMYVRWAEVHKLKVITVDQSAGEEAGIKSATIEITNGSYLYGKLAGEHGVHRLVRRSPFNSAGSRETSFAKVDVLPLINQPGELEIDDKDLKTDVYRAGGHGGQSVNTTDSAVRVTHTPTGISVAIQNERSQLQNKETALGILRSRLAQLQLEQHAATLADIKGPSQSNEFGSQIRNYVLDDRILKDLRTGYETHDPQKVLDGGLDPLIEAWLEKA
jgi:peptide chain release factor 2